MFDVIIVGGGPAGMAAALTLGRVHRTVLLVDAGQGRNHPAAAVHNFVTRDGTPPQEIRRIGREELRDYPSVQVRDGATTSVGAMTGGGFELLLSDGDRVTARRLLLATGLADEVPDTPGLAPLWGRSAFHCPYCHGYECTGKPVAVIGSTGPRVRLALQLSRFAKDVILCTDGKALAGDLRNTLEHHEIAVRCEPITRIEGEGSGLDRIVFATGQPLSRDAVFVENLTRQHSDIAEQLGCAFLPDGCVEADDYGRTSVAGVYAAGDMAHRSSLPMPFAAVIAAAASGTVAAGAVDQDLLSDDFALPNPFTKG
ncbi:NAD(P)/FAD-dependent oxidoreductase [Nocardia amamiensis]|uniref:NAD(P)/FAD-dependent oxidoreductase n=1 Tax=Nocardia amamiensis TaxID=404578 RepID=UPI00082EB68C|nr:NAD(P)/FAD-dependent oxidoreductase [Nocardia amamiensis]